MIEITVVTSSLLYKDKNKQLYNYFDDIIPLFTFLVRRTLHHLNHNLNGEDLNKYRTRLKQDYGLTNRFAKAVVTTAKSTLKLAIASGDYLHSTYAIKIKKINTKIIKTKAILNNPKTKKHRIKPQKTKLFWLQMKKNKLIQLQNNGSKPMITFGTKKLLNNNKDLFIKKRDNQIVYIGDKNEHLGNQQFKLFYNKSRNKFTYKVRVEDKYIKDSKYIYGEFIIKDNKAKKEILKTLKSPKSNPLSFRIIKRNEILYLQIMYRIISEPKTRSSNGVLGGGF